MGDEAGVDGDGVVASGAAGKPKRPPTTRPRTVVRTAVGTSPGATCTAGSSTPPCRRERLGHDLALEPALGVRRDVLPAAAAATRVPRAGTAARPDRVTGVSTSVTSPASEPLALVGQLDSHALAGQPAVDEDHPAAVLPGDGFATDRHRMDLELDRHVGEPTDRRLAPPPRPTAESGARHRPP